MTAMVAAADLRATLRVLAAAQGYDRRP